MAGAARGLAPLPRLAVRPAAAGCADLPRRARGEGAAGGARRPAAGARGRRGCEPLHGAARRLPAPPGALERPGGRAGRLADRRPHPARGRGAHRALPQPPGAAHGPRRRPHVPRAARPGAQDRARRLCASGPPLREAAGGGRAAARPLAHAALPGVFQPAELPRHRGAPPRPHRRGARRARAAGEVRHDAVFGGGRGRDPARPDLQRRPLRRAAHGGGARPVPAPPGAGRGRSGRIGSGASRW